MDNDKVESLGEDEKELMSELQDMPHAELVAEFMDLHAAFVAAEKRIATYESAFQDVEFIIQEATGDVE